MNLEDRLSALLRLAEQLGIQVRYEPMDGVGGGLCVLAKQRVLFVDTSAELEVRYERILGELAGVSELDELYVVPEIREEIDARREGRK